MRGVKGGTVLWGGNGPMGVTLTPMGGCQGGAWSHSGGSMDLCGGAIGCLASPYERTYLDPQRMQATSQHCTKANFSTPL